ncbi:MAG TPA: hypothetical protein VJS65_13460 [Verrucomicrobiae bacterium]|nr:hypothetical protein [Verrucomicrobiae bacterium]
MSRTGHSPSAATAPSLPLPSLADDAAMLASASGKWQSDVVKMTVRDGTVNDRILGIEFVSGALTGQSNAPDARAKLFTSSLSKGIPDVAEASTSLGDGSFRDVRLQESNGVRTITITRTVDPNDPNPAKRQRIYDRFYSVSFRYELKNNVLTLKGFPGTNKVNWGVSEFIVPHEEITFKVR